MQQIDCKAPPFTAANATESSLGVMTDSGIWTRGLAYAGAITLTPLLMWALARAFPPRRPVGAHIAGTAWYSRVETASQIVAIVAIWVALLFAIRQRVPNTFWLLGYGLGWIVIAPVTFIALCTLPRGITAWTAFWRFHEQKHGISLRFLVPLYALLFVLGIASTVILFAHRNT
jgi:hypothetical protein